MSVETRAEADRSIDEVTDRVLAKFPGQPVDSVRTLVVRTHGQYAQSRIRDFVPVLVEREVVDELRRSVAGT